MSSLESIFASLAISGVSIATKAVFSFASNAALKKVSNLVQKSNQEPIANILYKKLFQKLELVTCCIKSLEISGNAHSTVFEMASDLERHITETCTGINSSINLVASLTELISLIDNFIPYLSLSIANSNTSVNLSISPSLLLSASLYISNLPSSTPFTVSMYSLFGASIRAKNASDFTWKLELSLSHLSIRKSNYSYTIQIVESFNDGLYHQDDEARIITIKSTEIDKIYVSDSSLLNIPDANGPVLVLKVQRELIVEWIAIQLAVEDVEDDDDDDGEDQDKEQESENTEKQTPKPAIYPTLNTLSLLDYIIKTAIIENMFETDIHRISDQIILLYFSSDATDRIDDIAKTPESPFTPIKNRVSFSPNVGNKNLKTRT